MPTHAQCENIQNLSYTLSAFEKVSSIKLLTRQLPGGACGCPGQGKEKYPGWVLDAIIDLTHLKRGLREEFVVIVVDL